MDGDSPVTLAPDGAIWGWDDQKFVETSAAASDRAEVRDLIADKRPDLLSGVRGASVDDPTIDQLQQDILGSESIRRPKQAHTYFIRCLERGVEHRNWDLEIPSPIITLRRPRAPFIPADFRKLPHLRELAGAFARTLSEVDPLNPAPWLSAYLHPSRSLKWEPDLSALLAGQFLYTAVRYGGVLNVDQVGQILAEVHEGGRLIGDTLVFDLESSDVTRRWYADPLSTILILRYRHLVRAHKIEAFGRSASDALRVFIRALAGGPHPLDRAQPFIAAARVAWRLEFSPFLYEWADGRPVSCSWPPETEHRLRLGVGAVYEPVPREPQNLKIDAPTLTGIPDPANRSDLYAAYRGLMTCLRDPDKGWRPSTARKIRAWLNEQGPTVGPIPYLVGHWVLAIVNKECTHHSRINSLGSVRTIISRVGKPLFLASINFEFSDRDDPEAWLDLYHRALDAKTADKARRAAAIECQVFHDYLRRRLDVPPVNVAQEFGIDLGQTSLSVNANYISPAELKRAIRILSEAGGAHGRYRPHIELLRAAYWTGLRLGELTRLRMRDITRVKGKRRGVDRLEILVRSHKGHRTKSESSRRRLPLNALMPTAVAKELVSFYANKRRAIQDVDPDGDFYLFGALGSEQMMPSKEEFSEAITKALRLATGDSTVVPHSLRHAFANNMLIALEAEGGSDPLWDLFEDRPEELIEVSAKLRSRLLLNAAGRRRDLFAVAELLGHSSPQVTLQSYIHSLPWISYCRAFRLEGRVYDGLERTVATDAALLLKGRNAARAWRGRSTDRTSFTPLVRHWADHSRKGLAPDWTPVSEAEIVKAASRAFDAYSPIPNPAHLYRIGALRVRDNLDTRTLSERVELQEDYVRKVLDFANQRSQKPTRLPAKDQRAEHPRRRFKSKRTQHLRGHDAPNSTPDLRQMPELHAGFPALPKAKVEQKQLAMCWQRLSRLLRDEEQQRVTASGQPTADDPNPLRKGLRVFLENTNSSDHTLKFKHGTYEEALAYLRFVRRIHPLSAIRVTLRPAKHLSPEKAREELESEINMKEMGLEIGTPLGRGDPKWPFGRLHIRLLSPSGNSSHGAWAAQYYFALHMAGIS